MSYKVIFTLIFISFGGNASDKEDSIPNENNQNIINNSLIEKNTFNISTKEENNNEPQITPNTLSIDNNNDSNTLQIIEKIESTNTSTTTNSPNQSIQQIENDSQTIPNLLPIDNNNISSTPQIIEKIESMNTPTITNSPLPMPQIDIIKDWVDIQNKNSFPLINNEFLLEKNSGYFVVYENPFTVNLFPKMEDENLKTALSDKIQLHYVCVLKKEAGFEKIKIYYQPKKGENKNQTEIRKIKPGDIFILTHHHNGAFLKNKGEQEKITLPDIFIPYFQFLGEKDSLTYSEYRKHVAENLSQETEKK